MDFNKAICIIAIAYLTYFTITDVADAYFDSVKPSCPVEQVKR